MLLCDDMTKRRTIDPAGKTTGTKTLSMRVTKSQYEKLRKQAEKRGISVSELARQVLVI